MCISSALATSCGIGGGAVYSALILGVQEFEPSEAFPVSNFLILFCGLVTFSAFVMDKYKNPKNKFIVYDLAVIFGPPMLLGTKFGTIVNKTFSSFILTFAVLFILTFSLQKTYKNAQKRKEQERLLEEERFSLIKNFNTPLNNNDYEEKIEKIEMLDYNDQIDNYQEKAKEVLSNKRISEDLKSKFQLEDENPLNWERIRFIAVLELIIVIDQLIEGNSKLSSFIGIKKCSFGYWIVFLCYIAVSLYLIKYSIGVVQQHIKERKIADPEFKSKSLEILEKNVTKVVILAFVAGVVSSSVGIGGGMITNPLFASLGLDPKESSSTSNFLIITTSLAGVILFSFAGQLNLKFAFVVGVPCFISAFIGSYVVLGYINRTHKSSVLLVIMLYFLLASFVVLIFKTFSLINNEGFSSLFKFKSYC